MERLHRETWHFLHLMFLVGFHLPVDNRTFYVICRSGIYESSARQLWNDIKFNSKANAEASHLRVAQLMRSYYEEANARITYMNPMRFMYEESPYYEMGYIMGEIIERYRKVVEHAQRPARFVHMTLFDILKRVEFVQKLYFELYHLVRMMHETPRKWSSVLEFSNIEKLAGPEIVSGIGEGRGRGKLETYEMTLEEIFEHQEIIKENRRRREREKRQAKKEYEKIRQAYLLGLSRNMPEVKKAYNKFWPLDYGWEIDYYW